MWLAVSSRRRGVPEPPRPRAWPGITVVLAAYREREVIAAKIANARDNGYSGPLQIVVVAEDPETAEAARKAGAELIQPEQRLGKTEAVNRGAAAAIHPIVVITDADARLDPGSLAALARWFERSEVGAVAGEKRVAGGGQGLYWKFESWVKRCQSRRGTTIGVVGELAAVRRSEYRPIPRDVLLDDLWLGLDVIERGDAIRYEPEAVAVERSTPSLGAEWERRTRNLAGLVDLLWRRRELLDPRRSRIAADLWGHKLMRSVFGPLAHAALLLLAIVRLPHSRLAAIFVGGHAAGAAALVREAQGKAVSSPARAVAQVLFLQATALGGLVRYVRGERYAGWRKPERSVSSGDVFGSPQAPGDGAVEQSVREVG
jgi:glycosyltransferase involved in cell wall biosynthesis